MLYSSETDPFGFLTYRREQAFRMAINTFNMRQQASLQSSAHIYEFMSNRGKAFTTREWSIAHIMETFSGDEGARRREEKGIDGMVLDDIYFLHWKLVRDPSTIYESNQPINEPETITKARKKRWQTSYLSGLSFEQDRPHRTPLEDFYLIAVGYSRNEGGLITSCVFIDQDEDAIRKIRELDLSSSTPSQLQETTPSSMPPKPTITLKSSSKKKDEAR